MSYKIVDGNGYEHGTAQAMPEVLETGFRLSVRERIQTSKLVANFTISRGQAEGQAMIDPNGPSHTYHVEIVGAVLADVKSVRRMILRELGVRELRPVPEIIYDLRTFWARLRWLLTGKIEPAAFVPVEVPAAQSDESV